MRISILFLLFAALQTIWSVELESVTPPPEPQLIDQDSLEALDSLAESGPDTIDYRAGSLYYNYAQKTFHLNGKAQLKYRGATLNADTIVMDQESNVLVATGMPVIKDKDNPPILGYRMKYNIKEKIGQIYYASSERDGQKFNGMDIRRLADGRLMISRGDFCACQHPEPDYYFYSRRMVVKPKESLTARPVVLNIADVPVAVLPILVNPLQSGRRSGFLTPKFGGDQAQGFYARDMGYYWAINEYMDATLKGDVIEGPNANFDRTSGDGEFRYRKLYDLDGFLRGKAYLQEFSTDQSGWDLNFSHKQNLTPDGKTVLSGQGSFVSSRSLRQSRGLDEETVTNQQANAHLTYSKKMKDNKNLTLSTRQNYNLTTGYLERELPDARFSMSGPLFPIEEEDDALDTLDEEEWFRKLNYSYSNRGNIYYRKRPDTLNHVDSTQTWIGYQDRINLSYQESFWNVLNVRPSANYEGNWSAHSWVAPGDTSNKDVYFDHDPAHANFGDYFYRHSYAINADTKLYGIWRPEINRFTGIRHTISPGLSYTFAPEIDTNKHFVQHPLLHGVPYQSPQQTIGISLGNDFDIKYLKFLAEKIDPENLPKKDDDEKDSHENLRILNTSSNTSYNFAADSFHWAPINSSVSMQVIRDYMFTVNFAHSFYHRFSDKPKEVQVPELVSYNYGFIKNFRWNGEFNTGNRSQSGRYDKKPWSANANYRYNFSSSRVGENLFRDQVSHSAGGGLTLQPTRNWQMQYNTQYGFEDGEFAKHQFTFTRVLRCWRMQFTWTPVGTTPGWSFFIQITDLPDVKLQTANTKNPNENW